MGVHYIGEVHKPRNTLRRIFDVIPDGQMKWEPMDAVYDRIIIGKRTADIVAGRENLAASLKTHFPDEPQAIDAYLDLIERVARSARAASLRQQVRDGIGVVAQQRQFRGIGGVQAVALLDDVA